MSSESSSTSDLFNESHRATYCPEDNKLRLYIGRVPRDEYLRLREAGWQALHKQREAGGGDFMAHWTPDRRDTALAYAGIIEDEDMGPEERAADRAERFAGYRDRRADDATIRADRYDAGPAVHGFQSQARAERAAARHDRIGDKACDAWSKAEYWQSRTAGVISHALHVCSPSVRMGRIKELEADLRRHAQGGRDDEWTEHYRLRLAYENQMLEAQGGRAAFLEMEVGGWIGEKQIRKVNKSPATGRVVSVTLKIRGDRWGNREDGWHLRAFNVERLDVSAYTPPTAEDKAALEAEKKAEKAAAPKKPDCPLINPTDEDAARLQEIYNRSWSPWGRSDTTPPKVVRLTQAQYSALSQGAHARVKTIEITGGGFRERSNYGMRANDFPSVAKIRVAGDSVIVLADKPRKALTAEQWHDPRPEALAELEESFAELDAAARLAWLPDGGTPEREVLEKADRCGLVHIRSLSQFGWTDAGAAWAKVQRAGSAVGLCVGSEHSA